MGVPRSRRVPPGPGVVPRFLQHGGAVGGGGDGSIDKETGVNLAWCSRTTDRLYEHIYLIMRQSYHYEKRDKQNLWIGTMAWQWLLSRGYRVCRRGSREHMIEASFLIPADMITMSKIHAYERCAASVDEATHGIVYQAGAPPGPPSGVPWHWHTLCTRNRGITIARVCHWGQSTRLRVSSRDAAGPQRA